jgi:glutaredoxin
MVNNVIVFTLDGCKYCVSLKKLLNKHKISFSEIEVSTNKEIWDKVVSQTGYNLLPTVYITEDNSDEGTIFVPDVDYKTLGELIKNIKKYI